MALFEELDRSLTARPAAAIQSDRFAVLLHEYKGEHIAAYPRGIGLDDIQYRRRANGGIDSVAAVLQNPQCGNRRERLARCDHAVHSENGRPASTWIRRGTITVIHSFSNSSGVSTSTRMPGLSTGTSMIRPGSLRTTILAPCEGGKARIS